MTPRRLAGLALVALLCAGLGGRIARATLKEGPDIARDEAAVVAFLDARGWRADERVPVTANYDYAARVFRKPGCPAALVVSPIGAGAEAGGLFRGAGGLDWRFVHGGASHASPPTVRHLIDHGFALILRRPAPPSILAMASAPAQAPVAQEGPCAPPSAQDWRIYGAYEGLRTSAE
jgi:hypothetical protein